MFDLNEIYEQVLFECFGFGTKLKSASLIAAGNLNQGIQLDSSEGLFFLKMNFDHERNILSKEASGLNLLQQSTFLKIPETFGAGRIEDYNYLLSEFIPTGRSQSDYWENLGLGLAHLHLS
jgi:protein-ribulosamine 3-kinase